MRTVTRNTEKVYPVVLACAVNFAALAAPQSAALAADARTDARVIRARVESLAVRDLEKAFWACDHAAAIHGVHAAPVEVCSAIYDVLRDHKFGGDFNSLLGWWQQNRHIEHDALGHGH